MFDSIEPETRPRRSKLSTFLGPTPIRTMDVERLATGISLVTPVTQEQARDVLNAAFEFCKIALEQGETVDLPGIGCLVPQADGSVVFLPH